MRDDVFAGLLAGLGVSTSLWAQAGAPVAAQPMTGLAAIVSALGVLALLIRAADHLGGLWLRVQERRLTLRVLEEQRRVRESELPQ